MQDITSSEIDTIDGGVAPVLVWGAYILLGELAYIGGVLAGEMIAAARQG